LSTVPSALSRDLDFIAPLKQLWRSVPGHRMDKQAGRWVTNRFAPDHSGQAIGMTIGTSIFLIALGAILKFAVNATVAGFSIQTAGVILMVAGVLGLVIGLFMLTTRRPRDTERVVYEDRPRYR
jgi:hypothetical protein